MWHVMNLLVGWDTTNDFVGKTHTILESNDFDSFDDARAYVKQKIDKYVDFCIDEIKCDCEVEDDGKDVYIHFLDTCVAFYIVRVHLGEDDFQKVTR